MSLNASNNLDPGLQQAVKIVLKYEIQSLLSRLSDNGEEYIVITASTADKTCEQICSDKGEQFVQSAFPDGVKEVFLNFCTGGEILHQTGIVKAEESSIVMKDNLNSISEMRKSKRKSVPRRNPQTADLSDRESPLETGDFSTLYSEDSGQKNMATTYNENSLPSDNSQSALDLSSERKKEYMYTVDYSNDSAVNGVKDSGIHDNSSVSNDDGSCVLNGRVASGPVYRWMEEKLDLKAEEGVTSLGLSPGSLFGSSLFQEGARLTNASPLAAQGSGNDNFSHIDLGLKPKRRRARKSVAESKGESLYSVSSASKTDAGSATTLSLNALKRSPKTTKKLPVNLEFTDMKRAFVEIGNMAKCLICNKVLANKNNRTFHWRSHVGDKRFTCDICNKAFTHPSNMRSHRKIHTDEKPFPCNMCDRRFRRRDYLLQHLERFHYNVKASKSESEKLLYATDSKVHSSLVNGAANVTI